MTRKITLLFSFTLLLGLVHAQTSLSGKVTDETTNDPLIFGTVGLFKNGVAITGTETDLDGNYLFSNIDPGTYELLVSYTGYQQKKVESLVILAGKSNRLDVQLSNEGGVNLQEVLVVEYRAPLVEQDNTTSGGVITSEQIKNLPTRNINALAAVTAGLSTADEGGAITVRGSRSNATDYYVDGIRVQGSLIPETEIDQLQVITGGIEAKYGDVTGGVISITTKGPSNKLVGGIDLETSSLLDPYDNTILGFNLSGPLLKNKKEKTLLGFRLSGRYTSFLDDDPPAVDVFRVSDERLKELEANPLLDVGGNPLVAADFSSAEDVEVLKANPFESNERIDLTGKLEARITDDIDIAFTGAYRTSENQFTPGRWQVYNSHNNPTRDIETYRGNFRWRHRLNFSNNSKPGILRNVTYTLQAGYENAQTNEADKRHGQNLFNYGYIGNFDVEWIPSFGVELDEFGEPVFTHVDNLAVLRNYARSEINPVLANYNNAMGIAFGDPLDPLSLNEGIDNFVIGGNAGLLSSEAFFARNGFVSNIFTSSWNFHSNVGVGYNLVNKSENETFTFNGNVSFDLYPNGSEKGRHNIEIGFMHEMRVNRSHSVAPFGLWNIARQQANSHILGIEDGAPIIGTIESEEFGTLELRGLSLADDNENLFFRNIRNADNLNVPLDQFVNVDGLSPDQLTLDLFAAKELNDQGILSYFGYDYLGNKFDGDFEDFFTATDPVTGVRTFPVAPNRPIYSSFYIQDKFTFKDIIFRVGVRVDRYDANTMVLKDNYSLYEIMGAQEYHDRFGGSRPGNIGEDYKVYLDETQSVVQAYRDGDLWFRGDGTPVNSPIEIEGIRSGLVFPKYQDDNANDNPNYIKSKDFDVNASFEDYKPQINIMPRLAFSFPVSANANFFAHYDVLVQRPPSNTIATPLNYFYFIDNAGGLINNPNLKPTRTIDYEVGFQQKLSVNSALKLAAYYKEIRNLVQQRTFFPVPFVNQYTTYDNQDFGTVKGFTAQYDLRKTPTSNISFQANYTLQFADGTGSNANSQNGLTSRGNLRTLFPLDFDERHRLVGTIDYRFRGGNRYLGPRIFGKNVFENAGVNLQVITVSGRPFTATEIPIELGGQGTIGAINGARKPWSFTLNLRADKSFRISDFLNVNVYFRVSNLLDRRNVINVYSATGSPMDDGFLQSANGLDQIETILNSQRNLDSYLAAYNWAVNNPNLFSLPRRMYLGIVFDL